MFLSPDLLLLSSWSFALPGVFCFAFCVSPSAIVEAPGVANSLAVRRHSFGRRRSGTPLARRISGLAVDAGLLLGAVAVGWDQLLTLPLLCHVDNIFAAAWLCRCRCGCGCVVIVMVVFAVVVVAVVGVVVVVVTVAAAVAVAVAMLRRQLTLLLCCTAFRLMQ